MKYYTGAETSTYNLYFSYDGINYSEDIIKITPQSVFAWEEYEIVCDCTYVKIVSNSKEGYLGEVAFYDLYGNKLKLCAENAQAELLIDEQKTVPTEISYLNSAYFDEVYFPRTAYEHLNNLAPYEWVHPPLGKLIISIPIKLLGMTPFAYRLMGNIAGILMIPSIYILTKMLFKKTKYATLAGIIMAVDGMHFVQTRIGTVDTFLVLFILLEYLFMYKYIISKEKTLRVRLWALFWSGLFMGLAVAVKWTGVFAGIGLGIIFFTNIIIQLFVKKEKWKKEDTKIILYCIIFFVLIPLLIYFLSYIPFYILENSYIKDLGSFIKWQQAMYDYHHNLEATHPYSSVWYTWPVTGKSMLYWIGSTRSGETTTIALLGNPAIFWISVPCMIFTLIYAIKKRKFEYWFLIIAIVSMLVPYMKINRLMFLYHYFPILPFAMLAIVAFMSWLCEKIKSNIPIYILVAIIVITFIIFYPVYSGYPTSDEYLQSLKWLPTWIW